MNANGWLAAFLLTQVIEVPVYLLAAHALILPKRVVYACGASTFTHPVIWFCLPWAGGPYVPLVIVAEAFAVIVEALWGRLWRVQRPWKASLLANTASVCLGLTIRHAFLPM